MKTTRNVTSIPAPTNQQGRPSEKAAGTPFHDRVLTIVPPALLMRAVVVLGLCVPAPLRAMVDEVVRYLGYGEGPP